MIRFILFLILFYIIYKILQYFFQYLTSSSKKNYDTFEKGQPAKSKYENVEEADFKEIKPDDEKEKKQE
jgi:hypothetical protein